ncbi:MAG: MFS transporter [Schleiferilactobacillus perolens]|uniref:MFS transporter n=1 Tax=Schleiferilactobacillus perolens TaxID=100468 RepID=UPI0039EAE639
METHDVRLMDTRQRTAFIGTLLLGTFGMSISQSSLSTAYPTLMREFAIPASMVQWLTTGFMLVMCLLIPTSPWLLHNVPFKKLFVGVVLTFSAGTILCVVAPKFWLLVVGRMLEAIAVGIIFPAYQSVLLIITPVQHRGSVMGLAGLIMGSALAVGPIVSGVVLNFTSWRGLFVLFLIVMAVVLALTPWAITDVVGQYPSAIDGLSVVLGLGFIGVLYVLTESVSAHPQWGLLAGLLVASIAAVVWFVWRQLHRSKPLLNLRVFTSGIYTKSVFLTGISYIALIVTTILMPLYYQDVLGTSALVSGLAMVPAAVVLALLNPISGRLLDKIGGKWVILIGQSLIVIGMVAMIWAASQRYLVLSILMAAFIESGNAFVMMPSVTMGANDLPEDLVAHATAVTTTARQLFGSAGVAVATALLTLFTRKNAALGNIGSQIAGFQWTFAIFAVIGIIGALITFTLPDTRKVKKA